MHPHAGATHTEYPADTRSARCSDNIRCFDRRRRDSCFPGQIDRLWLCSGRTARSKDNLQSSWLPQQSCSHACEENYEIPLFSQGCSLPPEMGSGTSASFRPSSTSSAQVHCEQRLARSLPVNVDSDSSVTSYG